MVVGNVAYQECVQLLSLIERDRDNIHELEVIEMVFDATKTL